jgi:hypothetical protein
MAPTSKTAERFDDVPSDPVARWGAEVTAAKRWKKRFDDAGEKIVARYAEEKATADGPARGGKTSNIFWSNVQVMLAASWARVPKADVSTRFKDYNADVPRAAASMIERILNSDFQRSQDSSLAVFRQCIEDRFIPGMGQVWVRYEADVQDVEPAGEQTQSGAPPAPSQPQQQLPGMPPMQAAQVQPGMPTQAPPPAQAQAPMPGPQGVVLSEDVVIDYVHWRDFLYSPCRTWGEVRWAAKRVHMRRDALRKRFDKVAEERGYRIEDIPLGTDKPKRGNYSGNDADARANDVFKTAEVWEIWNRDDRSVVWYVEGFDRLLDEVADPLGITNFLPCPKPLVATTTTSSFLATADYVIARDQYVELDEVNARLSLLVKAISVKGVYDKTAIGVDRMLSENAENRMIPVDNWAMFAERGGVKGSVDWFPLDMVVLAIEKLSMRKSQVMAELYELLGISDLMRGMTDASETATAQTLKVQYGGARQSLPINAIAAFVGEALRIKGEIVAKHFQPQTLVERSMFEVTPDAQFTQAAIALLKSPGGMALYSIEVEADSIAAPDWAMEREGRTQFLGALGELLQRAAPLVGTRPDMAPFLIELVKWAASGFKIGKQVESILDRWAQAASQPAPQKPPSPADQKDTASAAKSTAEAEFTKLETVEKGAVLAVKAAAINAAAPGLLPVNGMGMQQTPMQSPQGMPPQPMQGGSM